MDCRISWQDQSLQMCIFQGCTCIIEILLISSWVFRSVVNTWKLYILLRSHQSPRTCDGCVPSTHWGMKSVTLDLGWIVTFNVKFLWKLLDVQQFCRKKCFQSYFPSSQAKRGSLPAVLLHSDSWASSLPLMFSYPYVKLHEFSFWYVMQFLGSLP